MLLWNKNNDICCIASDPFSPELSILSLTILQNLWSHKTCLWVIIVNTTSGKTDVALVK